MANHSSSKKSIRQTIKRTQCNKQLKTHLGMLEKRIRSFVKGKDKTKALEHFKLFSRAIDRSVKKGLVHANKASRKKSRLALLTNQAS